MLSIHMATKSSKAFCSWRRRMNLSYREAAKALGLCMSVVGFYSRGIRRDRKEEAGKSVEVPKSVLLACAALENNLPTID